MAFKSLTGFDSSSQRVINVADPSSASDAATKSYVDNALVGLQWKQPVQVATTTNGTLATAYANGQSVDGVTLATGMRILIKDQTTQTENGIYTVNASGAPTRASDADSSSELLNATVFVVRGTANADKAYTQTTNTSGGLGPVIGTDNIVFAQFGGGTSYSAGNGLTLTGTTFDVTNTDGSITVGADTISLASQVAGNGLTLTSGVLNVVGDASLNVAADQIGLASGVAGAGLTLTAGVLDVGQGTGITVAANTVSIDSTVCRRFSQQIGNGSSTSIAVTHGLGTKDITWSIRDTATDAFVVADVVATSTTVATFTFASAPATNAYSVTITG